MGDNATRVTVVTKKGTTAPYYAGPTKSGGYNWYYIYVNGVFGYIRADTVKVVTSVITPTPDPVVTPTPDPTVVGTAVTIKTGCNFRRSPGGDTMMQIKKNVTVDLLSLTPVKNDGYNWYHVKYQNTIGYLREDVLKVKDGPVVTPDPTVAPTPVPSEDPSQKSSYLRVTMDKVFLRKGPGKSSEAQTQVNKDTVLAYSTTQTVAGATWYQVQYNGYALWVIDECVHVMTIAEYNEYISGQPTTTPEPVLTIMGYVKTKVGGVNLRKYCVGDTEILGRSSKNVVMPFFSDPLIVQGQSWYYVKHPQYGYVYVLGDYVTLCNSQGTEITPAPVTVDPGKKEATYTTLRLGSTGDEVLKLVTELKNQGYYKLEITNVYNSFVETAVTDFQKAKNLTADGIAGSDTQHALFGTVPPGQGTGDLTMTIYVAEKIDWFKGDIQSLWAKGQTYKVYDVKTGIVWQARRWSGFNHVDAEPLTAADTARLCSIYGVKTAKEIDTKNLYQRRPCLVTIGTRTFACSLYGIPHNYPDGDTISNNNFNGQLCIHFTNSKTSDSKKVDSGHQEAIQYAWEHAPNGHK